MLNISKKKELVERLLKRLDKTEIAILVDFEGLDVLSITELRTRLKNAGVEMEVVKNTLLSLASKGTSVDLMKEFFKGPNAIVTSAEDPVAPAKILTDFAKNNEHLTIKVAVFNGKLLNMDQISQLAAMESKEKLLAKLVYTLNAVPTSLVNVLSGVPRSFVNVLDALKTQKEAA